MASDGAPRKRDLPKLRAVVNRDWNKAAIVGLTTPVTTNTANGGPIRRYASSLWRTIWTIFTLLVVGFVFLLLTESVSACGCETSGSRETDFDQAKQKAKAIFAGRVVEVVDLLTAGGYSEKRVKLKLERYWKGQLSEEVSVFTGRNDCTTTFIVGYKYLVLAYHPDGERELYTDHCMKSGLVRNSSYQLKRLGKGKKPSATAAKHKRLQLTRWYATSLVS